MALGLYERFFFHDNVQFQRVSDKGGVEFVFNSGGTDSYIPSDHSSYVQRLGKVAYR